MCPFCLASMGLIVVSATSIVRWTLKILFSLNKRPYRHGQLCRHLGRVSQRRLARTLRNLESTRLFARRVSRRRSGFACHCLCPI
jgi:DNA-binding HxlR family transcriptional regulator